MKKLTQKEIGQKYRDFASNYDTWEGILEWAIVGRLRRGLLCEAQGNMLDVGIGTGKNLRYYSDECDLTGIDYTPAMLEVARKRAKNLGRRIVLKRGDAQRLPFKAGSFDTVVDTLCLCTYPNPVKALQEMKRVCKRDGQILLLEHGESSNGFLRRLQQRMKKKQLERLGCHVDRDIVGLVRKAGLKILSVERRFFGIFYVIRAYAKNDVSMASGGDVKPKNKHLNR